MAELTWQITMLGPSRVGKTSLLTALQVGAEFLRRDSHLS